MIANYHTHTWRCRHADGTDREYVENAIASGLKILGFSDHSPCIYPHGYEATYKMFPSQLEEYVHSILQLREEYRGQIEIYIGFEAEYYPDLWESFLHLIEPYPIDYLILGQHFLDNEYDSAGYCGARSYSEDMLHKYCLQCMEGLKTGKFMYFAHPDLFNFKGDAGIYEREMGALCRFCRDRGIPLEMNLLGLREGRNYPRILFWEIAAREGNTVILGSDAHHPEHVFSPELIAQAKSILELCGVSDEQIIDRIELN